MTQYNKRYCWAGPKPSSGDRALADLCSRCNRQGTLACCVGQDLRPSLQHLERTVCATLLMEQLLTLAEVGSLDSGAKIAAHALAAQELLTPAGRSAWQRYGVCFSTRQHA